MPRRLRIPKPRTGAVDRLTPDQRAWFFTEFARLDTMANDGPCTYAHRIVFASAAEARTAWRSHRDELLEEYSATHPGRKPWPARLWEEA